MNVIYVTCRSFVDFGWNRGRRNMCKYHFLRVDMFRRIKAYDFCIIVRIFLLT